MRGFISAESQSTGAQRCCLPGGKRLDLRVVNEGAGWLLCPMVSQLIDNTVDEDRSAEDPK